LWYNSQTPKNIESWRKVMNVLLEKHDMFLILDALESFQLDVEHGEDNGYEFEWTEKEIENLKNLINNYLED
jgi:hypothetical protein